MPVQSVASDPSQTTDRVPPYSEEAERGVLGSVLLDSIRVVDICVEAGLLPESFYVPANRTVFGAMLEMWKQGSVIDALTLGEHLKAGGALERVGGSVYLERLIDGTPTSAHAEHYIDIVRQKHILRRLIACARTAENTCYTSDETADSVLGKVEQAFMEVSEGRHGTVVPWNEAVKETMSHVDMFLETRKGLSGLSTGFAELDGVMHGLRPSEMIIIAARPSMGKTSLAMNIAENVALGKGDPNREARPVGIFSLEMAREALVLRMLCSHARVNSSEVSTGRLGKADHGKLINAASVLSRAKVYLDDTGGLDILEIRARARRMKKNYDIGLVVIDYLQLAHSHEFARQGRQLETAAISGSLKAMAKELRIPVIVLSQLSRAPDQRDKLGKPKLSDLRDSGAIEQDADVVCMLRRPCKYPDDEESDQENLAVVEVVKHRNGPTGEARLNFEDRYTLFTDLARGVDHIPEAAGDTTETDDFEEEEEFV